MMLSTNSPIALISASELLYVVIFCLTYDHDIGPLEQDNIYHDIHCIMIRSIYLELKGSEAEIFCGTLLMLLDSVSM